MMKSLRSLGTSFRILGLALLLAPPASIAEAQRIDVPLADASTLGVYLMMPQTPDAPLVVLMPGGSGDESLARDLSSWLGLELAERGWAVAIPVSPNGRSFRGANNALIPQLIGALQSTQPGIATGRTLLAGISNGGMSALEIATAAPENYLGVMAVPALIPGNLDLSPLAGMPIYLRIGDQDEMSWAARFPETRDALVAAGAEVNADTVFMAGHMFTMDWENLDPWLLSLPEKPRGGSSRR